MKTFPLKRFSICMATMTPLVVIIALAAELTDWSYGVSFAALAIVGTVFSMAVLYGNPLTWFRHHPEGRRAGHT